MKSRTFRRTFALFAEKQITEVPKIALLLLALALPAVAQKPTIQLIPFTSFFVPAAAACGFDVLFTPQAGRPNKERLIQFANTAIIAGPLFVTITNLSTGKTINLNISGPQRISFSGNNGRALGSVCNTAASRRGDSGGFAAPVTHLWPGGSHGRSTIQYQLDTKCDWYSARRVSVVAVRIVGCKEDTTRRVTSTLR